MFKFLISDVVVEVNLVRFYLCAIVWRVINIQKTFHLGKIDSEGDNLMTSFSMNSYKNQSFLLGCTIELWDDLEGVINVNRWAGKVLPLCVKS